MSIKIMSINKNGMHANYDSYKTFSYLQNFLETCYAKLQCGTDDCR